MASRVLLVKNRNNLRYKIAALDRLINEIEMSGTASASISAGGGSQSYTHADLDKLERRRSIYATRLEAINMALATYPNATGIRHVQTVRSGVW
ncbi:MAG: hypothetical protein IIZ06_00225 [Kiritimatiellae bacterium]|nr:hypothetical protein [Kiritimatiellia bacterium]